MSAIKFQVGEPKKIKLSFDSPKTGTNSYGDWYMYGFKSDIDSDADCFFATPTLHVMIQTLGAKEGDEITIEKCQEGDIVFFKVNGLTLDDIKKAEGGKPKEVTPSGGDELSNLREENMRLKAELESLKANQISVNEIPF